MAFSHLWISWWQVINRSTTELPLTVSYDKISLGRLRFWIHMQDAVYSLQQFGGWPWGPGQGGVGCSLHPSHAVALVQQLTQTHTAVLLLGVIPGSPLACGQEACSASAPFIPECDLGVS